jgi:hypothetical protein
MKPSLALVLALLALGTCAACSETTAGQRVTANGTLVATVQMDQYWRDSRATQAAQEATVAARAYALAATASVATLDTLQRNVTATAVATRAKATANAVATQDYATAQARQTELAYAPTQTEQAKRDATATVNSRIRADATATQAAGVVATGTAAVVETQTAIRLTTEDANAQRERVFNGIFAALAITALCLAFVCLIALWRSVVARIDRRSMIQTYGPNNSQALLTVPDGAGGWVIADPTTGLGLAAQVRDGKLITAPLTPETLAVLAGAQHIKAVAAEHSPFPPVKPEPARLEKREWHVGPVGAATQTQTTPVSVEKPLATALPAAPGSPKLPAPETSVQVQKMFVKTDHNTKAVREQQDIIEFIEDGWGARGLARSAWVGRLMTTTGNKVGRRYYDTTMKTFEQLGLIEKTGDGWQPVVPLAEALDAFGLAHAD